MRRQAMIKVLITDDDALIRDSLKIVLDLDDEIEVVGTAINGDDAYKQCLEKAIDVILMDIRMPVCDGIIGTKKIKETFPYIKVIILTTFQDNEYIYQGLKYGAQGYLLKNTPSEKIRQQIKLIHSGTMLFHEDIAGKVSSMIREEVTIDLSKYGLTQREVNIIELISEGLSNKEIAEILFLGESTIKNHITSILGKLNLRDRTQIAVFYLKKS